jgi:hypothetical protein
VDGLADPKLVFSVLFWIAVQETCKVNLNLFGQDVVRFSVPLSNMSCLGFGAVGYRTVISTKSHMAVITLHIYSLLYPMCGTCGSTMWRIELANDY